MIALCEILHTYVCTEDHVNITLSQSEMVVSSFGLEKIRDLKNVLLTHPTKYCGTPDHEWQPSFIRPWFLFPLRPRNFSASVSF